MTAQNPPCNRLAFSFLSIVLNVNLFEEEIGWKGVVGGGIRPVKSILLGVAVVLPANPPSLTPQPTQGCHGLGIFNYLPAWPPSKAGGLAHHIPKGMPHARVGNVKVRWPQGWLPAAGLPHRQLGGSWVATVRVGDWGS